MSYYDRVIVQRVLAGHRMTAVEHEQPAIIRELLAKGLSPSLIADRLGVGAEKVTAVVRNNQKLRTG